MNARHILPGVVLLLSSIASQAQPTRVHPRPLRDILVECGCLINGMPEALLSRPVIDHRTLVDRTGFVVAFWPSETASAFEVLSGNVADGSWRSGSFETSYGDRPEQWPGAIWNVERERTLILVGLRVAIDGIATSILTPELRRITVTYGMVLGTLPTGIVLYEHAQPHFAPTHYVRLAALDLKTRKEKDIYPPKPDDAVRRLAVDRDRKRYAALGFAWCAENNQHCDPERFDNSLYWEGGAEFDATAQAFAFGVDYRQGADFVESVVAACAGAASLERIECHETPLESWRRLFPTEDRRSLLRRAAADPKRVSWR